MDGNSFRISLFGMSLALGACCDAQPVGAAEYDRRPKATQSQPSVIESPNFRIYGVSRLPNARAIADDCEALRRSLCRTWFGDRRVPDWSPKCDVVVHATKASYLRAVGQDQFATVGSSRIDTSGEKVTLRRLDILASRAGWFATTVPHELTHLIMADEFGAGELPAWADEGMAVLADPPAKQSLHARDFRAGRLNGSTSRLASFVGESSYPSAKTVAVFYGQSASLVKYLVARGSPTDFVRFLHLAEKEGYDAALTAVYRLGGVHVLEREWLASTLGQNGLRTNLASTSPAR